MPATCRPLALAGLLLLTACLGACASKPPADDPDAVADYKANNDPLEPTNRVIYAVNDGVDSVFLKPLALLYRNVVPDPVQKGAHNALANLGSPVILANDLLQGKPKRAGDTVMRFVINTTAGIGGVMDVAADAGYKQHNADFGMTLALWGASAGPYLFLPVFGPSNPRDGIGMGVDYLLDPLTYTPSNGAIGDAKLAKLGLSALDARAGVLDDYDRVKAQALDPYATIRSLSRQYRQKQIDDAAAAPN
jgi:phospholipid-binding lipoprotein MlaA